MKSMLLAGTVIALAFGGAAQAQQPSQQTQGPYDQNRQGSGMQGPQQMQQHMQQMQMQQSPTGQRGSQGYAMSGANQAQNTLSRQEVQGFFQNAEQTLTNAVRSGNTQQIRQWTANNIADDAVFSGTRVINNRGVTKSATSMTLTKQDLTRLQTFVFGMMPDALQNIHDFNTDIRVQGVTPIGQSSAMVQTLITQHRVVGGGFQQGQDEQWGAAGEGGSSESYGTVGQGGSGGGQGEFAGGFPVNTRAICRYVLDRNPQSGNLQIVMGICDARTRAPL